MSKCKSLLKKTTAVTLAMLVALTTLFSFSLTVDAKAKKYVKSIKVSSKKFTLTAGSKKTVKVTVNVVKKASKKFTVKTSSKKIAKVSAKGTKVTITAVKKGKATITVTTKAKGKKGKKLSAKIAVTVKAKSTPTPTPTPTEPEFPTLPTEAPTAATEAPTAAPTEPATEAPTEPATEAPTSGEAKLDKITVTAAPESISVGATSQVTVASATEGVAIAKVEYASSNENIATVDDKGVVTGKMANAAPVVITVTAYDAAGNSVSGTVNITVTGTLYPDAKIKDVPESYTLSTGATRKLNPSAVDAGAEPVFNYTSDKPEVATVDDKGTITAVAAGEAKITVTVAGTTASAVCVVTVKDSVGIASFKATHAKIFTLTFTGAVAKDDQDKINIVVKKGSATMEMKKEWAEDGSSVNLSTDSILEATDYTVAISSDSVSIDEANSTAKASVEKYEIKDVKVTTKRVNAKNYSRVYFDALDNYGDKIENTEASEFNWQLSCDDAQVKTDNFGLNVSDKDFISLDNLGADDIGVKLDQTTFGVQAIYKKDANIRSGKANVDVKSLKISRVDILDIDLDEGAKNIYEEDIDKDYNLIVDAVDNYGEPVDWEQYYPGTTYNQYNNEFKSDSDNTNLASAPFFVDNKLIVTVYAHENGTAKIYIAADDPDFKTYNLVVKAKRKPLKIKFPNESDYSIASYDTTDLKIPVKFEDQYGDEMVPGAVDNTLFGNTFTPNLSDNDLVVYYDSSVDGDFVCFDSSAVDYDKSKSITVTFQTYDDESNLVSSAFKIKVDPQRKPDSIKFTSDIPTSLIVGETADINFTIMDNRGTEWGSKTGLNGAITITIGSTDTHYVDLVGGIINSDGTGTITIQGMGDSTVNKDPKVALKFALFDGATECAATTFTPPTVVVYPQLGGSHEIQLNAAPTTVNAGQTITLTFQAYKDDVTKHTTYTHLYKDVTISQYDYSDPSRSKTATRDVNFVNGVATVEIEAMVACPELVISTEIFCVGYGYVYPEAAEKVKVNPGAAVKYVVKGTYDTVGNYDDFTVTCVDKNGNTVTDYTPSGKTYISAKNKNGDNIENLDAKFLGSNIVDGENRILLNFTNGVATFGTDTAAAFDVDDVITITTGDLTGSYKEVH